MWPRPVAAGGIDRERTTGSLEIKGEWKEKRGGKQGECKREREEEEGGEEREGEI